MTSLSLSSTKRNGLFSLLSSFKMHRIVLFSVLIITVLIKGSEAEMESIEAVSSAGANDSSSRLSWPVTNSDDERTSYNSESGRISSSSNSPLLPATVIRDQNTFYRVRVNEMVELPCVIENRRQANVLWQYSKSRIPETLSIDYFYYRKDYRIRVIVNATDERVQAWNLEIRKIRLDDEGYYLCKVMAEPESLKRAVFLKVEVDLTLRPESKSYAFGDDVSLICNTSYQLPMAANSEKNNENINSRSSSSTPSRGNSPHYHHHSHPHTPRIIWLKDGQRLQTIASAATLNSDLVGLNNMSLASQLLDFKIEYYTRPVLWSRLHVRALKPTDLGLYTCMFRNQSVSSVLSFVNVTNNRLLETGSLMDSSSNRPNNGVFTPLVLLLLSTLFIIVNNFRFFST